MFKLKVFVFPVILLSVILFGFTKGWSLITEIKTEKTNLKTKQEELDKSNQKRQNIESLTSNLSERSDLVARLNSLIPEDKNLAEIGQALEYIGSTSHAAVLEANWDTTPNIFGEIEKLINSSSASQKKDIFSPMGIKVSVAYGGKYEAIRSVLADLYRLNRLTFVQSVSINRSQEKQAGSSAIIVPDGDGAASESGSAKDKEALSDLLEMRVVAYFAYAGNDLVRKNAPTTIFSQSRVDFSPLENLGDLVQPGAITVGTLGKNNLFLPE